MTWDCFWKYGQSQIGKLGYKDRRKNQIPIVYPVIWKETCSSCETISMRKNTKKYLNNKEEFFKTDHLRIDLKGRSVRGGAATVFGQGCHFLIQIGSTAVLARILTPADFGMIAMVLAVIGFASLFKDLGLSMATVQKINVTHEQISVLFWINVTISVLIAMITVGLSPVIAMFYGDPRLTSIGMVLSLSFVFGGLTVQHQAILRRQMRFKALAIIPVVTIAVSVIAAVVAAILGAGYWSLVIMELTRSATNAVAVWFVCRWRPCLPHRGSNVRGMLRFGANITGHSILNYFSRNLDNILIARVWGSVSLGLYSKAYSLMKLPLSQINAPIAAVAIPALSRLQSEPEQYRGYYLKMISLIVFVTMPLIAFMIVMSKDVILFVLGSKWIEASSLLTFLGIAGLLQPIGNSTGWLFVSQDRTKDMFQWGLLGGVITIVAIVIGLPWGALGVAISYAIAMNCIQIPALLWFVGRKGPVRTRDIYKTIVLPACVSLCVIIVLLIYCKYFATTNPGTNIVGGMVLTLAIILGFARAVPSGRILMRDVFRCVRMVFDRGTTIND